MIEYSENWFWCLQGARTLLWPVWNVAAVMEKHGACAVWECERDRLSRPTCFCIALFDKVILDWVKHTKIFFVLLLFLSLLSSALLTRECTNSSRKRWFPVPCVSCKCVVASLETLDNPIKANVRRPDELVFVYLHWCCR